MKFEIVPRFGEIQLFIFAASIFLTIFLYGDLSGFFHFISILVSFIIENPLRYTIGLFLILGVFCYWVYGLFLSIKYVISEETPPPSKAGIMVWSVLLPLTLISMAGSFYWYTELSQSDSFFDKVVIVFPFVELLRCMIILALLRMRQIEYWKRFDYKNAKKEQVIVASIGLLAVGLICRFLTTYSPYLVILMMYEIAGFAASAVGQVLPSRQS